MKRKCGVKRLRVHGYGGGPGVYFGLTLEDVVIEWEDGAPFIIVWAKAGASKDCGDKFSGNSVFLVNTQYIEYIEGYDVPRSTDNELTDFVRSGGVKHE